MYPELYQYLLQARLARNVTQEHMAHMLGIGAAAYSKLELGKTNLTLAHLGKICGVLGLNLRHLVDFIQPFAPPLDQVTNGISPRNPALQVKVPPASEINFVMRAHLIALAAQGRTIDYVELVHALDLDIPLDLQMGWEKLGVALSNICLFEYAERRPLLTVLVIDSALNEPRYGFYNLAADLGLYPGDRQNASERRAYYTQELHECYGYWQAHYRQG